MPRIIRTLIPTLLVLAGAQSSAAIDLLPTDQAGFVGEAGTGPVDTPTLVTSYEEYLSIFGPSDDLANPHLAPSVAAYFANGGPVLWIVRAAGSDPAELIGEDGGPGQRTGLQALLDVDTLAMVAIPGATDLSVQNALIAHAEQTDDRMAILDPVDQNDVGGVLAQRALLDAADGHAALYYPWVEVVLAGEDRVLPPSGFVAAVYARVRADDSPANEPITANGLTDVLTASESDQLNAAGVNPIRDFGAPQGIRVWGARTLSSDPEWRYVAIRRTTLVVAESILDGTLWALEEDNGPVLWQQLEIGVSDFLYNLWVTGWLLGFTPEDAYFVHCDATTHTVADLEAGRTVMFVGLALLAPAEFTVLRLVHERDTGTSAPPLAGLAVAAAPNPFNPRVTLRLELPEPVHVRMRIFDARGRLVRRLVDRDLATGAHALRWDGRDDAGRPLPSGAYLARTEAGPRRITTPLTLVR
jgi:phage tail sheath protein FI